MQGANGIQGFTSTKIFTGDEWLANHVLLVQDEMVIDIVPFSGVDNTIPVAHKKGSIVPAFIDAQVYGASGKLFSQYPSVDALHALYLHNLLGGTHYCLPTIATNTYAAIYACIDAIKLYWSQQGTGIGGLHIEGPWINSAKRGAHIENLVHQPAIRDVTALLAYGKGVIKMITLAPEVCDPIVINMIKDEGILVSAGHSNATYHQASDAFNNGLQLATHLYNAMSALQHRGPGMVGAIMQSQHVMASIIADGHHVDFAAISIAKKIMKDRLFLITDAVTETKDGYYPHQLDGDKYVSNGTLSGSALQMNVAIKNCVQHCGIATEEALRMASTYVAKALGLQHTMGKLLPGYTAAFTCIDENFSIV